MLAQEQNFKKPVAALLWTLKNIIKQTILLKVEWAQLIDSVNWIFLRLLTLCLNCVAIKKIFQAIKKLFFEFKKVYKINLAKTRLHPDRGTGSEPARFNRLRFRVGAHDFRHDVIVSDVVSWIFRHELARDRSFSDPSAAHFRTRTVLTYFPSEKLLEIFKSIYYEFKLNIGKVNWKYSKTFNFYLWNILLVYAKVYVVIIKIEIVSFL